MTFPRYPDPARRAKILHAQQLRERGLTIRQIAERLDCAPSTALGFLRDYELFRTDLIRELASDQIVSHLVHLSDPDDPHHDQRLADVRELRLLLASLPTIRRDETERTRDLAQGGVAVDRYGNRYPKHNHFHDPTPEEIAQIHEFQPPSPQPAPDQPLTFIPKLTQTEPNNTPQEVAPAHKSIKVAPAQAGAAPSDADVPPLRCPALRRGA